MYGCPTIHFWTCGCLALIPTVRWQRCEWRWSNSLSYTAKLPRARMQILDVQLTSRSYKVVFYHFTISPFSTTWPDWIMDVIIPLRHLARRNRIEYLTSFVEYVWLDPHSKGMVSKDWQALSTAGQLEYNPEQRLGRCLLHLLLLPKPIFQPHPEYLAELSVFFNETIGYWHNRIGFIKHSDQGDDIFVHESGLMDDIRENDKVSFDVEKGLKGWMQLM